jgi:hypothetical protein
MQAINNVLSRLKDFEGLEDGTYDYFTKSIVSFDDGYQVTFHNCDKDYTIEEYDRRNYSRPHLDDIFTLRNVGNRKI